MSHCKSIESFTDKSIESLGESAALVLYAIILPVLVKCVYPLPFFDPTLSFYKVPFPAGRCVNRASMPTLSCPKCGKEFLGRSAVRSLTAHMNKCTTEEDETNRVAGAFHEAVENRNRTLQSHIMDDGNQHSNNVTLQNDFMDGNDENSSHRGSDGGQSDESDSTSAEADASDSESQSDDGYSTERDEVEYEEGGKWDYTGISSAEGDVNRGDVTEAEAKLARLARDIGLTNSQASAVMKWSNERIMHVRCPFQNFKVTLQNYFSGQGSRRN